MHRRGIARRCRPGVRRLGLHDPVAADARLSELRRLCRGADGDFGDRDDPLHRQRQPAVVHRRHRTIGDVELDLGTADGANGAGTGRLNYNIYKDGGYSNLWGDGTAGTTPLVVTTAGPNTTVPIYGKIDPGQDAPVGNYKDTVIMSVNP